MTRDNLSRRNFLKFTAGGIAAAALATRLRAPAADAASGAVDQRNNHLVWVWRFDEDGSAADIRRELAASKLGIILKTHDGARWMGRWDKSEGAVQGAEDVQRLGRFFEAGGVPFHAWVVVKGENPIEEAHMAAAVLSSGARSLTLDLEPNEDGQYWQGSHEDAVAFGKELRRLQPAAWISVAPDPRPWRVDEIPMAEFAAFANEIAPQTYWDMFDTPTNHQMLRKRGYNVEAGVTPELVVEMSQRVFAPYKLPVRPIGPAARNADEWRRFVQRAFAANMSSVSAWRMGTADSSVFRLLNELPAKQTQATKTTDRSSADFVNRADNDRSIAGLTNRSDLLKLFNTADK